MPVFLERLTVPAASALDDPARQTLVVVPGRLTQLRLYVPPGPRGEVALRLVHNTTQILPARENTWWRPDDAIITYVISYPVTEGDEIFALEGGSPNATFQHIIDFELTVDTTPEVEEAQAPGVLAALLEKLQST